MRTNFAEIEDAVTAVCERELAIPRGRHSLQDAMAAQAEE